MIEFARSRHIAASPDRIWPFVSEVEAFTFTLRVMAPRPIRSSFDTSLERLAGLTEGAPVE